MTLRTIALTLLALAAFASNSLLTRLALGRGAIDALTFTAIRLASGAIALAILVRLLRGGFGPLGGGSVLGAWALFAYAAPFTLAYVRIGAAVGALVLFGMVQLTMIGAAIARGERPGPAPWAGIVLGSSGLAFLAAPAVSRPDPLGLALMAMAGVAWGLYSLIGKAASDPLASNARSFLWSALPAIAIAGFTGHEVPATRSGVALAIASGALTSGLGYAVWYAALPRLSVTQAAVAQLAVPILAGMGAVALLGERPTVRLGVAGAAVLSGVSLVLFSKARPAALAPETGVR